MSYSSEVLADSPLRYYRLGEASGTTAADSSGNGHDGTYTGPVLFGATGMSGDGDTAVILDGNSATVDLGTGSDLQTDGDFTYEACITPPPAGYADPFPMVIARGTTSTSGINLYNNTGIGDQYAFIFLVGGRSWGDDYVHASHPTADSFHLAGVRRGTTAELWINGSMVASAACSSGAIDWGASPHAYIGSKAGAFPSYFNGAVDEVAIYDSALSSARIAAHYAAFRTPALAGRGLVLRDTAEWLHQQIDADNPGFHLTSASEAGYSTDPGSFYWVDSPPYVGEPNGEFTWQTLVDHGAPAAAFTDLFLRKHVSGPPATWRATKLRAWVDNDIWVWVNNCLIMATSSESGIYIEQFVPDGLWLPGDNLIAVRCQTSNDDITGALAIGLRSVWRSGWSVDLIRVQ